MCILYLTSLRVVCQGSWSWHSVMSIGVIGYGLIPAFFASLPGTHLRLYRCKSGTFRDMRRLICGLPQVAHLVCADLIMPPGQPVARHLTAGGPRLQMLELSLTGGQKLADFCHFFLVTPFTRTIQRIMIRDIYLEEQDSSVWPSAFNTLLKSLGGLERLMAPPILGGQYSHSLVHCVGF